MISHRINHERIELFDASMRVLASRMLCDSPRERRWEEADDILQEASIRLALLDLARRFRSSSHFAKNHETVYDRFEDVAAESPQQSESIIPFESWIEFHETVDHLPEAERELFDLFWYSGLETKQAVPMLGLCESQIRKNWLQARHRVGWLMEFREAC